MKKAYVLAFVLLATLALAFSGYAKSTPTDDKPTADITAPAADPLNGTCGDENACTVHQFEYHTIDGNLIKYVGRDKMNEFIAAYQDKGEDCNIISFVKYCNLSREDFVKAMEWEDELDHTADDHAPVIGGTAPYTYGEFVDAIFGDDPALSQRIFSADIFKATNV